MTDPIPLRRSSETPVDAAKRLDQASRDAGRRVFQSALDDFASAADGADAICDLKSIPEAWRDRLRRLALHNENELTALRGLAERNP